MNRINLYKDFFRKWYDYLNVDPRLEKNVDVFTLKRAHHSLGEIHSVLMAYFMNLELIMSDDSDAADLVEYSGVKNVDVWNLVKVYSYIGNKESKNITLKEVENIIRCENSDDSIKHKRKKKERYRKVKDAWRVE